MPNLLASNHQLPLPDSSGNPGNTKQNKRVDFWGRLREFFVDRLLQDVQDGTMGLLEQIRTQESLHSLTPCCQFRPSLKEVIANSHRLQGQGWESYTNTEAPIPEPLAQVLGTLPLPCELPCEAQGRMASLRAQEHQQETPHPGGKQKFRTKASVRTEPCSVILGKFLAVSRPS